MEFLMLIPIAAFIYGWVKSNPAVTPPPDLNPVSSGMVIEDDDNFFGDNDNTFTDYDTVDTSMSPFDSEDWDGHTLADDLMYDPAYSWNSTNIYHHDD